MANIKIDAMDKILEIKSQILAKYDNFPLSLSCDLTDLLIAAHNAGRLEAAQEHASEAEIYEKRTVEKINKLLQSCEN